MIIKEIPHNLYWDKIDTNTFQHTVLTFSSIIILKKYFYFESFSQNYKKIFKTVLFSIEISKSTSFFKYN